MTMVPCPSCNRHLKRSEVVCPFCDADVAGAFAAAPERAQPTARLSRAALFTFAAAASLGAAHCGGESEDSRSENTGGAAAGGAGGDNAEAGSPGGTGGELATPVYGAPPPTGGSSNVGTGGRPGAGGASAGGFGGGVAPPYGIPPPIPPDEDAGTASGGTSAAVYGAPVPLYGAAPIPE